MAEYAVTITFAFENEDIQSIVLDTVHDVNVSTSSSLAEHPVPSGEYVADHMYKDPASMTIRGTFSLNGGQSFIATREGAKLASAQELFERIKNEGALCDIIKVKLSTDNVPLFLKRSNMALTNIQWVEKINSLDFTFTFRQVLTVDVQQYDVDISDAFLPNVTEPQTLSFTNTLIDWDAIDKSLIEELISADLIEDAFLSCMSSLGKSALVAAGVSAVVATVTVSVMSKLVTLGIIKAGTGVLAASGPIGWTALALIAATVVVVGLIIGTVKWVKKSKYRVKQFEYFEDDKKNQKEVVRFSNFVGEIHKQFEQLNSSMLVYQISSNEEQECMLSIGGNYYIFKFTKNNTSGRYSLKVFDINESELRSMNDISGALQSFDQCTTQNYLFRAAKTGEYVYLMNVSEETSDLSNYMILVSGISPDDFKTVVQEIFKNALLK